MIDKNISECQNGCSKYSKSMDEIVQALAKHRNAALLLKDINEKQKKKLSDFREQRTVMQDQIDQLELDQDLEREFTEKVISEKRDLENNVKALQEELSKKEQDSKVRKVKEEPCSKMSSKIENDKSSEKIRNCWGFNQSIKGKS